MLPHGGVLSIRASENSDTIVIDIVDSGDGIDPDVLESIFERFFTTKKDDSPVQDSGAGLGLAFCKMVIDGHRGSISVESEPGHGSTFKIVLPKTTIG